LESLDDVMTMWSGTHHPDDSPMMSIKADASSVVTESKLIIQPRSIRGRDELAEGGADYELLGRLGEGGIGIVHFARQASINRTVAIKQLKPKYAEDRKKREEFLSEAVVTGDLEHPNIVPIYDLLTSEKNVLFYSMKRVKGTAWHLVMSRKSPQENLEILMKLADAVAFAHSRGVVHRDLKPENVMLGDYGEVLLMDWGLAMSPAKIRGTGMGGTPAYMAPEMATGPVDRLGFHSDVYLLGAILFEVITGKPPHTGKTITQCLLAAAKNEIQPTDRSGELLDIARKAMATKPKDRYDSVLDFQAAIREYQSHSESISLSTRAQEDLDEARQTEDYQAYARALFGYQEALSLWEGNTKARSGVAETTLAYADSARRKGDYDLGMSLLDAGDPAHAELYRKIEVAQSERSARRQRLKVLGRFLVGAAAALFIVITGAAILIWGAKIEADEQREIAQANEEKTTVLLGEKVKLLGEKEALLGEKEAALRGETAAKIDAEEKRKAAVLAQTAAEDAQEKEAYGAYIARIGFAASKIEENAFNRANGVLDECPKEYRNWEWDRLEYLCTQATDSFDTGQPVNAVAYSPDAKRIVTGGWGGDAHVWDEESGKQLFSLPTGGQYVFAVAYSSDGRYIATGSNQKPSYVKIWNAQTGKLVGQLVGHEDAVLSVVFSKDGTRLLTSSYDNTARLWNWRTGEQLQTYLGHDWWVWSASFSPDEQRIVTASQDGSVIVWPVEPLEPGKPVQPGPPFRGHTGPVYAAAFSPNGQYVASAGYDRRVLIWEPDEVESFHFEALINPQVTNLPPKFDALEGHQAAVRSVKFNAEGNRLVSASNDNTVRVWDFESQKLIKTLKGHGGWVLSCEFSPDGKDVLSGSHDHQAKIWSLKGYEEVRVFQGLVLQGHVDAILGAEFSHLGGEVVTASRDRTARKWNVETREFIEFSEGHKYLASTAIFFDEGKRLLTAAIDNTTRIWDVETGTQLLAIEGTGARAAAAVSSDGKWIFTGSDKPKDERKGELYSAKLYDAHTGDSLKTIADHKAEVTAVAISPDKSSLFTGDVLGRCRLLDAGTGEEKWLAEKHSRRITAAYFLPGGKRIITASNDNTVAQWDVSSGDEYPELRMSHPNAVTSMALSADGSQVLTVCVDRVVISKDPTSGEEISQAVSAVTLWDVETADKILKLATEGELIAAAFSPDNTKAVTTGADHMVRLWNLASGKEITSGDGEPYANASAYKALAWSAVFCPDGESADRDGEHVLTVGGNGACLWEAGRPSMSFTPHGSVASAHFSRDGKYVITGSWDHTAKIWDAQTDAQTGKAILKLVDENGHQDNINDAVFSPVDNSRVLTASDDGTVKLWEVDLEAEPGDADGKSTKVLKTFEGHTDKVRSVVFSPDGRFALSASDDKTAQIWSTDPANEDEPRVLRGHQQAVLCAAFYFPDPEATTANDTDTADDTEAGVTDDTEALTADATKATAADDTDAGTADAPKVITGGEDNQAIVWDLAKKDPKPLRVLEGHTASVTSVAFSPDGTRAITGSRDNTAKIWEFKNGEELLTLDAESEVTSVGFSPDGSSVLTGSRDGTLILWLTKKKEASKTQETGKSQPKAEETDRLPPKNEEADNSLQKPQETDHSLSEE